MVGTLADPAVGIPGARTNRNDTGQGREEELPPPLKRLRRTAEANEIAKHQERQGPLPLKGDVGGPVILSSQSPPIEEDEKEEGEEKEEEATEEEEEEKEQETEQEAGAEKEEPMRFIGTGRGRGRRRGSAKSGAATKKKARPPTLRLLLRRLRYQEGSSG